MAQFGKITVGEVFQRFELVPAVDQGAEGFGSRLVQMSIEGQLGGKMERRFAPEGLEVDLAIPVKSIRS